MRIRTIVTTLALSLLLLVALVAYLVIYSGNVLAAAASDPDVHGTPELPELAQQYPDSTWLIYPEGFRCYGTEGCPNDYLAIGGEVGPVLPEGVEYYDPAKHDCVLVQPADVEC
ncbi:membrane protein [Microbacterium phage Endor]|nr:membrane protein [Microbacterium phage Endor]